MFTFPFFFSWTSVIAAGAAAAPHGDTICTQFFNLIHFQKKVRNQLEILMDVFLVIFFHSSENTCRYYEESAIFLNFCMKLTKNFQFFSKLPKRLELTREIFASEHTGIYYTPNL